MRIYLLIILFIVSFSSVQAKNCLSLIGDVLNKKSKSYLDVPELKLMAKIESIEKMSSFLRKLKDNQDPAINLQIKNKIAKLDSNLMINQWSVAHREVKTIFREMEMAYVISVRNIPILKELDKSDPSLGLSELKRILKKSKVDKDYQDVLIEEFAKHKGLKDFHEALKVETQSRLVKMGNNYHEYVLVRHHLEDILADTNCTNATCQRNVRTLLDRVGIVNEKERIRFGRIIGNYKRPTFQNLSKVMNENPIALLTRLKKERNAELFAVVRDFLLQPEIVEKAFKGLYNLPGFNRVKAVRILKIVYDAQARNLHFPKVNRLVRNTLSNTEKLPLLKELNSTVDYDELLVTFARRVDDATADTWRALKESASTDPDFLKRMKAAQIKAKARGDISLTFEKSSVSKIASIIVAGGSIGYFYFLKDDIDPSILIDGSEEPADETESELDDDETIEAEGDEERVIEELAQEVRAIYESEDTSPDRDPSSNTVTSWFKKLLNFFSF